MPTGNHQATAGKVTRLRVFNYLKRVMTDEQRCPNATEVAQALAISQPTAAQHMRALYGATGLPMVITSAKERIREATENMSEDGIAKRREGVASHRTTTGRYADFNNLPVDKIMSLDFVVYEPEDL